MQKILNWLGIRRYTTKQMCILAMFIALTVVLSIVTTARIGFGIEISFKFVPVLIIGALYGPFSAGLTSLLGDIISVLMFPAGGPPIIGLCVTEFLSGFIYGALFYNKYKMSPSYVVRVVICVILQFFLSIYVNSYILYSAEFFSTLAGAIAYRSSAAVLKIFLQSAVLATAPFYLKVFSKFTKQ